MRSAILAAVVAAAAPASASTVSGIIDYHSRGTCIGGLECPFIGLDHGGTFDVHASWNGSALTSLAFLTPKFALSLGDDWTVDVWQDGPEWNLSFFGNQEDVSFFGSLHSSIPGGGTLASLFGYVEIGSLAWCEGTQISTCGESGFLAAYSEIAPVPLPAAGWLLVAGLGALSALRWSNRRKRAPNLT